MSTHRKCPLLGGVPKRRPVQLHVHCISFEPHITCILFLANNVSSFEKNSFVKLLNLYNVEGVIVDKFSLVYILFLSSAVFNQPLK